MKKFSLIGLAAIIALPAIAKEPMQGTVVFYLKNMTEVPQKIALKPDIKSAINPDVNLELVPGQIAILTDKKIIPGMYELSAVRPGIHLRQHIMFDIIEDDLSLTGKPFFFEITPDGIFGEENKNMQNKIQEHARQQKDTLAITIQ
jgi:hypothetical protein